MLWRYNTAVRLVALGKVFSGTCYMKDTIMFKYGLLRSLTAHALAQPDVRGGIKR